MKITSKKVLGSFLLVLLLTAGFFGYNFVFAQNNPDSINVTLTVEPGIAIVSPAADVAMSTNLGLASDSAIGSATWAVKTNNITGYYLSVKSSSTPAMVNVASSTVAVADATTTVSTWSIPVGSAAFGFSAFGNHVNTGTWGSDSVCGSGNLPSASLKYSGFNGSNGITVATSNTTTSYAGESTTVCFAAGQNQFLIPSGSYAATIVATAVTL